MSSSYSNNFNEGGNTEVKDASINLVDTATGLGNDYKIETESVRVKDLPDNKHNYSAILTNDGDSYSQNIKITTDDKAGTVRLANMKHGEQTIPENQNYTLKSGETITVRFELDSPMSFDSLVMVRHNQEDTETVLLDYEDLVNNLEPDSTGMYSFDVKMPYSDTEIILKTTTDNDFLIDNEGNYIIRNYYELCEMSNRVNSGKDEYVNGSYVVANDISASERLTFKPIGTNDVPFKGTFDGQGHTIAGLNINNENESFVGLFGRNDGTIKNIGVVDSNFNGCDFVGGIAGRNNGTITNSYNTSTVKGKIGVGGIAGYNDYGTISNCYNKGTVSAESGVGGILGNDSFGLISDCYNTGTVSSIYGYCGGVVGNKNDTGSVSNCYYLNTSCAAGNGSGFYAQAYAKASGQFKSGEVANLLNKNVTDGTQAWYQNVDNGLTPDDSPVLVNNDKNTVYKVDIKDKTYSNFKRDELDISLLTQEDLRTYQRILEKDGKLSETSKIAMGYGKVDNQNNVITVYMADTADRMGILMHQGVDGKKGVLKLQGDYPKYSKTSGELLSDPNFVEPDIYTDGNGCIFISQPEDGSQVPELTVEYTAKPLDENKPILYTIKVTVVDTSIFTSGVIAGGIILDTLDKDDPDYAVVQDSASTDTDKESITIPTLSEDANSSTYDEASKNPVKTDNVAVQTGNPVNAVLLLGVLLVGFVIMFVYRRKFNNGIVKKSAVDKLTKFESVRIFVAEVERSGM